MSDETLARQSRDYELVARAIAHLHREAAAQPSLADLASALAVSPFHLQRTFSAWAGISPKRFLQYLTKEQARRALAGADDILDAAYAVGLSGGSRLHDLMVSCEAMSPGEIRRGGAGLCIGHGFAPSPFGEALVAWTSRGICHLAFVNDGRATALAALRAEWPAATLQVDDAGALDWLRRIFPAAPTAGRLHLVLRGTNFQIKVWEALLRIPPGAVLSYGELARRLDRPGAARAVGGALAANVVAYLIPCHRVIRESGGCGGYRWGGERKRAMLAYEAAATDLARSADSVSLTPRRSAR